MRTGVDDFALRPVRQINVRAFVAKSKLQYGHARNLQPVAQGIHFRGDETKVLGKEWQPAQRLAQFDKQVVARTIDPAAIHSRRFAGRNLPELLEPAEVIEPDVVAVLRRPTQPLNPPLVAALLHHIPAVERIPPALSRLAEKIGRHS